MWERCRAFRVLRIAYSQRLADERACASSSICGAQEGYFMMLKKALYLVSAAFVAWPSRAADWPVSTA